MAARPATEVLFDRICRENGITHRLTGVRSPTTTGKVERFHQSLRRELLDDHPLFADLAAAQAAIDVWRLDYNTVRPHQSLDMATPASRFRPAPADGLPLRLPAGLVPATEPVTEPPAIPAEPPAVPAAVEPPVIVVGAEELVSPPDAVELDRMVPPSGNLPSAGSSSGSAPGWPASSSPSGWTRPPSTSASTVSGTRPCPRG